MINNIRKNFTITPNELINDGRLSIQARFVFIYLCSKPADWRFQNKVIEFDLNIGRDSRIKYTNELKNNGWLEVIQKREGGVFKGNEYILHETPCSVSTSEPEKPNTDSPRTDLPHTEKTASENSRVGKNPTLNNTNNNTNTNLFTNTKDKNALSLDIKVLNFLNEKKPSNRNFDPTPSNLKHIKARIKEKHTFEDFKKVIEYKVEEWKGEAKTRKWIRPATLFGDKFNSYLVDANDNFVAEETTGDNNFELKQSNGELL